MTEKKKNKLTPISELGEFGLIKHLTRNIKLGNPSSIKGVGDDAAVIDNSGKFTLLSTDILIENVHFDLVYTPLKHLGYKAAVVNFSDIAAMNAIPKQITITVCAGSRITVEALEAIYDGIKLACEKYNVDIVGGDTTSSKSGLVISISVLGEANEEEIVYRNGSAENELICVTGDLGGAYMGLLVLEREKEVFKANPNMQPDLQGNDYILERQLKPEARTDIIKVLKELEVKPTSMIDVSDGLASDVLHLCHESGNGCNIYEDKLPLDPKTESVSREFNIDPTIAALSGGEDYELLFTIKQDDYEKIKGHPHFTVVGHMTEKSSGYNLISRSGQSAPLTAQGWDAFLDKGKGL